MYRIVRYFSHLLVVLLMLPAMSMASNNGNTEVRSDLPPLPIEPTGIVKVLPKKYPETWFWVQDIAFGHMTSGKVALIDAAENTLSKQYKGSIDNSLLGNLVLGEIQNEVYMTETFYSRGVRGERTDVVTIWSKDTLEPIDEVVWSNTNRYMGLPQRNALQLIDNEKLLLVFNLNPATSVTVIDIESRKILNEIAIPGCALIYPTGKRGFSSICSNGSLLSTQLTSDGKITSQKRTIPFFNPDTTPVFEHVALVDGFAYIPSFTGIMHKVNLKGDTASVVDSWSMVSNDELRENWRPGGVVFIDSDEQGNIYVIMHPDGHEGSQQQGGTEIWVFNSKTGKRVSRYPVQSWAISLGVSRGKTPLLMLTNGEMQQEVYDAMSGKYIRTISAGLETPLVIIGSK